MFFFIQDGTGLIIAIIAAGVLYGLPALGLTDFVHRLAPDAIRRVHKSTMVLVAPIALFPALDHLLLRTVGLYPVLALHLFAALASLPTLKSALLLRPPRFLVVGGLIWLASIALFYLDFDMNERLYQSLLTLDLVKHASVTESLYRHGIPLVDPFVSRSEPAGYYYFFYLWAAQVRALAAPLVDARMAFAGTLFWVGLAFPALLREISLRARLVHPTREVNFLFWIVVLCFVAGLDIPAMLLRSTQTGIIENQVDWWSEEIGFAFTSILWVPHHVSALIAIFFCLILLTGERDGAGGKDASPLPHRDWAVLIPLAGLSLASAFGMSIWITLSAAPVFAAWCIATVRHKLRRPLILLIATTLFALLVDSLYFRDLIHGRDDHGFPIGLWIRGVDRVSYSMDISLVEIALRIASLPLGYFLDFGLFAIGTYLYWKGRSKPVDWVRMDGVLIISACVGLLITSFVRSTILNNDLGWRGAWFAQLPAMLWTAAILQRHGRVRSLSPMLLALLLCGMLVNLWDMVGARVIRFRAGQPYGYINSARAQDYQERKAYTWLNHTAGPNKVVQHNPVLHRRRFNFGLYGQMRPAVADAEANLFGAVPPDITRRIAAIRPIFEGTLTLREIGETARRQNIDYLLFTSLDPVWSQGKGVSALNCIYRDKDLCIIRIKDR